MEYYSFLNFKKEPFSNSPEPEFFYEAPRHMGCLQKLELAVRLRRGLNVVIGDVGTGKTTLCRKLIQQLSVSPKDAPEIETHLMLDPSVNSNTEFLQAVNLLIGITEELAEETEWQLKEKIKNYLFNKGVNENKIVVLIIDEGQKIPENCIEILREFLNYETNNFKLLQIIIFAQLEFKKMLREHANLADRINVLYYLNALNFRHMRQMIKYRISIARNFENISPVFTFWGFVAIYLATGGYPRKVVSLCHQAILMMIIRGRTHADFFLVKDCLKEMHVPLFPALKGIVLMVLIIVLIIIVGTSFLSNKGSGYWQQFNFANFVEEARKKLIAYIAPVSPVKNIPDLAKHSANIAADQPEQEAPAGPVLKTDPAFVQAAKDSAAQASTAEKSSVNTTQILPQRNVRELKMPDNLGFMVLRKGRTLWRAVHHIYGEVNSEIMEAILKANPHLKNENDFTVGMEIKLPAIPAKMKLTSGKNFIVVLQQGHDLMQTFDIFHEYNYQQKIPQLSFFSYWNSREGLIFAVVIDKNFDNTQKAREAINALPPSLAQKTQIIARWENDTVYFNRQALKL